MRTKTWVCSGLVVVLTAGVAVLAQGPPQARRQQEASPVTIRGHVVDAETGKPIEYFALQKGRKDAVDPSRIDWQHPRIPVSFRVVNGTSLPDRNPDGEFSEYVRPGEGDRDRWDCFRVLADGYEPELALDGAPKPADAGKTIHVTVRLRRGRTLDGRVVDHAGRPAAGAWLCLIRPGEGSLRVADGVVGEWHDYGLLDPSVTHALTDDQGRFRILGVGDATLVGISAPTLHFWIVPVPPPGEELAIQLPEPATLRIPYAIAGDAPETHVWLSLNRPEDLQRRLSVTRNFRIANGGEAILRDVPAGEYTLWRSKMLPVEGHPCKTSIEYRKLTLGPGETVEVSFVREGKPVSGTVILPPQGAIRMRFVAIRPAGDFEPGWFFKRWLDIVACDAEGRFRIAHVPPGEYVVHAAGYRDRPRYEPFGTFNDGPYVTGSAPVTVPPDGNPPEVRITLEDRRPPATTPPPIGVGRFPTVVGTEVLNPGK